MLDILMKDGDLYFDEETADIRLTNSVGQAATIRLRWFLGEWRLGPELGLPYYEDVLVKNPNIPKIKRIMLDKLYTINEVQEVESLDIDVSEANRNAKVTFKLLTDEESILEEVSLFG